MKIIMANKKIKILHIMSGFGGGISSFIRNKAENMKNENIQFDVATYDQCSEDFSEAITDTGGKIYKLINPKKDGWQAFKETYTSILKENDYDIIYCHINGYRVLPYYYYYAKKYTDAEFYVHAHLNKPTKFMDFSEKLKLQVDQKTNKNVSDKVVGCGALAIESVFGEKTKESDMVVIPNSVEVERFIKTPERSQELRELYRNRFNLQEEELVIGHIGRLELVKNHELTIELAKYIKSNDLLMKILIIGEGNRERELKDKVNDLSLDEVIIFTGRISPIEDFFPALDVMLLPSFAEGLPTVVVEAQASGVPVVMSDVITEEVDLGFDMIEFVPIEADMADWIDAINRTQRVTIPNEDLRKQEIKNKNFSNETSAQLFVQFLRGNIDQYTIT
jgi:glycosyltransferase EpsF